jgi:hypothetical protein
MLNSSSKKLRTKEDLHEVVTPASSDAAEKIELRNGEALIQIYYLFFIQKLGLCLFFTAASSTDHCEDDDKEPTETGEDHEEPTGTTGERWVPGCDVADDERSENWDYFGECKYEMNCCGSNFVFKNINHFVYTFHR